MIENQLESKALFTIEDGSIAYSFVTSYVYPWEAVPHISSFILDTGAHLSGSDYRKYGDSIWISKKATVSDTATIHGPCIIMEGSDIRPSAFIRGSALIGRGCVIGNSTELKNCILFDSVQVPHFNYVGDSILGYRAHLGAGAITSNVKSDKSPVSIKTKYGAIDTGYKKLGAILSDLVEVGCNSVLCPGTVIGRGSIIYPLSLVRGYIPENTRFKH